MGQTILGLKELEDFLKNFANLPDRAVNNAVKRASRLVLAAVKANAPVDTGQLKSNLMIKPEKKKKKGKRIYRIRYKNDLFDQVEADFNKTNENRKRNTKRKKNTPYFYPSAMEYGYFIKGGKFIPGFHFMRKAITQTKDAFEQRIIDELEKELDKLAGK
jgi:HK97 gp10 family phage protein